jgi:photosystem II stability/assembly factor-like uncharacterized protein
MMKTIPVLAFVVALVIVLRMDWQYEKHHHHFALQSRDARVTGNALMENGEEHQYWDYLRQRDPATGEIPRGIYVRELDFAQAIGNNLPAMKGTQTIQTTGWQSAGPNNAGGRTNAIGIDIANEANMLIATAQGGVWRSTDSGQTWSRTTAPGQLKDMSSLVQDHRKGKTGTWYAGTGELISTVWRRTSADLDQNWHSADIGNGIYKSTDDGISWNVLPSTVDATPTVLDSVFDGVWDIAVDNARTDSDIVYAAGFGAIMRSNDGGVTWTHVLGDPVNISFATDVAITSTGILYAFLSGQSAGSGTPSKAGIWRSTDGFTWTNITPSGWPSQSGRMRIAIAPSDENIVYVGGLSSWDGYVPTLFKYTYHAGDGSGSGGMWEDRSENVPQPQSLHDATGVNTYGGYAITLRVLPTDTNTVFIGGTNLFRSSDGFMDTDNTNWIGGYYSPWINGNYDSSQSYPNHHPDNHDLAFLPSDPNTLYSANDGGIYVSHDCLDNNSIGRPIEWTILNSHDQASILYCVAMDHATPGDTTLIGGFQDQGSWLAYGGNDWAQYDGGDGCMCAIADHKAAYYMSSQNGYIDQWFLEPDFSVDSVNGIRPQFGEAQFVTPWMLDPTNSNQMYCSAGNSLWLDTNLAVNAVANWLQLSIDALSDTSYITALGMSTVPAHRIYYGTSDGHVFRMDDANTSSPSPAEISGSIFPNNAFVSCIAVDPQNADSIVVCFSNYDVISIFASNNGGTTWHDASGNLEQNPNGSGDGPSVRWVSIVDQNGQTLYLCGTSVGLFSTMDITGPNVMWNPEGAQTIGYAIVENIDVRQSDGFVAIATQGSGVYTTHVIAAPSSVGTHGNAPTFALTIAPNPASDKVTVSFSLPGSEQIGLSVVDVTGKTLLRTGNTGELPSGPNTTTFDCSRLPTGSYFVELETVEGIETRRLVIER